MPKTKKKSKILKKIKIAKKNRRKTRKTNNHKKP